MTLQQLKYVCMVAETGKITEAAKKLYISQPSLTNAIHELEKEMNVVIFNRTNKGISLSAEGEIFLGYARQVLELVNKERAAQGLETLTLDTSLCEAAAARAKEITELFSHTRPNGQTCFTILKEYDISYRAVGENIAAGQSTQENVMQSWMNSEGHRANILSASYNKLGVGYVKSSSGYGNYWVQIFTD